MTAVITRGAAWSQALEVRAVRPDDRARLEAMHDRCSQASRVARWRAPVPRIPRSHLEAVLAGGAAHVALVATADGEVLALGSAVRGDDDLWDLGVLVRDDVQGHGIGSALITALTHQAGRRGARAVAADVLPQRRSLVRALRRLGPVTTGLSGDGLRVVVRLAPPTDRWPDQPAAAVNAGR